MKRAYIATTEQALQKAKEYGRTPVYMHDTRELIEADEFVFIGPRAQEMMHERRSRGLPAEELSWFDGEADAIRHFHSDRLWTAGEVPDWKPGEYKRCTIDGLGKFVRWRLPEVIVTAGPYSSGKSLFSQILVQDFVRSTGLPVSIFAWEDSAEKLRAGFIRYRDTVMRDEGGDAVETFLNKITLAKIDSSQDRLLSDYLDLVEYQAKRFGTKFFVLDPWNEFDHQKHSRQTETEYVREVMKAVRRLADKLSIIININTHVSAEFIGNEGSIKPFKIAHSFGSSQFANKADRGFCVVRTKKFSEDGSYHMLVRQDKVKEEDQPGMKAMGRRVTMLFRYSHSHNTIYYDGKKSEEEAVQKIWKD